MNNPTVIQDHNLVTFKDEPVYQSFASKEQGKAVHIDQLFVEIIVPFKEKDSIYKPATDIEITKYPQAYEAYKNQEKIEQSGTVLQNWNYPSEAQIKMLLAHKVRTVEQVAALDDVACKRMGNGGRVLRDTAIKFVAQADGMDSVKDELKALKESSAKEKKEFEGKIEGLEEKLLDLRVENKELNNLNKRLEAKNDTPISDTKRGKRDGATSTTS